MIHTFVHEFLLCFVLQFYFQLTVHTSFLVFFLLLSIVKSQLLFFCCKKTKTNLLQKITWPKNEPFFKKNYHLVFITKILCSFEYLKFQKEDIQRVRFRRIKTHLSKSKIQNGKEKFETDLRMNLFCDHYSFFVRFLNF